MSKPMTVQEFDQQCLEVIDRLLTLERAAVTTAGLFPGGEELTFIIRDLRQYREGVNTIRHTLKGRS